MARGKVSFSAGLFQQLSDVSKGGPHVTLSLLDLRGLCFSLVFILLHGHKMGTKYSSVAREEKNANSRIPLEESGNIFPVNHNLCLSHCLLWVI